MISSVLIYNSFGVIDESAIERFASLIHHTEQIVNLNLENGHHIENTFPNLIWLIRDFSLELGSDTSQDYMDNILSLVDITSLDSQGERELALKKNKLRQVITHNFEKRNCFTLPRPVTDEASLRQLGNLDEDKLRPIFVQEIQAFTKILLQNVNPKQLGAGLMTGNILNNFLFDLTKAINNNELPIIPTLSERYFAYEVRSTSDKLLEEAEGFFQQQERRLPLSEINLYKSFTNMNKLFCRKFAERVECFTTSESYAKSIEEFSKALGERFEDLEGKNESISMNGAQVLLNNFIENFSDLKLENKESFTDELLKELEKKVVEFVSYFMKETKSQSGFKKGLEFLPGFLFGKFGEIQNQLKQIFQKEIFELKDNISIEKKAGERLSKQIQEHEK